MFLWIFCSCTCVICMYIGKIRYINKSEYVSNERKL